jgi:hypothetical protein
MDYSLIRKIIVDCFRIDRIDYGTADVLTVAHDCDRYLLHKGKYYSPLIGTLEDDLDRKGVRCLSIARIISRFKGDRAYGNVHSPEGRFARALIHKRLSSLFRSGYPYSRMEEAIWGDILDATKVRKVVGILPSRELCVACRKRGIWVADVQHGVIADSHPWYGERFRRDEPVEYAPNAFLCWDPGTQEVIDRWAVGKGISTLVTGNRWVARFLRPSPDDILVQELSRAYEAHGINSERKPSLLVTLAWGVRNIPNGFMVDALRDVIRSTSQRYHWSVRLHPNAVNGFASHEGRRFPEFYRNNLQGCVESEVASHTPLPIILTHSDLHISWGSSVSIEAAQLGIRSVLLDPYFQSPEYADYYGYYRRVGMIDFVEATEVNIQKWIDANLGTKGAPEDFDRYDATYRGLLDFLAQ